MLIGIKRCLNFCKFPTTEQIFDWIQSSKFMSFRIIIVSFSALFVYRVQKSLVIKETVTKQEVRVGIILTWIFPPQIGVEQVLLVIITRMIKFTKM